MKDNTPPPRLPSPPEQYSVAYFNDMLRTLRLFFTASSAVQPLNVATFNIDVGTLPTEAELATLRSGDVYRDTTAGDVLKIKT